ncbi:CoA pyrophosphatase [Pseudidiomarina mangrovi]|uniref:CoA pyrophosphatase n=1 Tax=Pseudidiomarina mangrovi TaxID=2487133 RepID=UPI000FCCCDBC|nr:CoA pyrophosphatase [Pseudidiomarina mangrovi]CAI8164969.1 MAG: putative Nudix hydrolase NudL [Pseudidiomarina mangrovi]
MTRDEFIRRFHFHQRPLVTRPLLKRMRPAAVLIALLEQDGELQVILTQRQAGLRHHAGQISFPGGSQEPDDHDLLHTALREAQEEIGLNPADVQLIGQLQDYPVISNFIVRPFVALVTPRAPLRPQQSEVAEIFTVPLKHVLHQRHHYAYKLQRFIYDRVYFIPYQQRNIWGATAGMLRELADHIHPEYCRFYQPLNE